METLHRRPGIAGRSRFNLNRAQVVDENFIRFVREWEGPIEQPGPRDPSHPVVPGTTMTCRDALELFESQMTSRHQDIVAREMRARGEGFYTIGCAGHEGNAVLGRLTRHTDMAFLHYRSGAFMAERARKVPQVDMVRNVMLSLAASAEDPVAGGRHKIWGSRELFVPPQTSTIASHLPKAVGTAMFLPRAAHLRHALPVPLDSIIVCSFGDASVGHAAAQTAFNLAARLTHHRLPVPILFVCEDNGIGISVETPPDWIESAYRHRYGLTYLRADGLDLIDAWSGAERAVHLCRTRQRPVFFHLRVVRLLGHAGSDAETEYHTWEQIEVAEAKDPLLRTADLIMRSGVLKSEEALDLYEKARGRVRKAAEYAATRPRLSSAAQIMAPLAPYSPDRVMAEARRAPDDAERARIFGPPEQWPERLPPRHMAALINLGLHDLLIKYPEAVLFGEDVAKKGGVYHVTTGLTAGFGVARVFNTLLDETAILGMATGAAHVGLLPIPEIQYLAYYHNAEDQIRGEACSLQYFSQDQFRNPMVMRIQGWAYQKGFGGHFHNDNSIAALRDVPGLIVATPSRGDDAVAMMRTCMALAKVDGRVVAFLEPIALYMTKDLYEPKDGGWCFSYPPPGDAIAPGEGRVYHEQHGDLTILTYANGLYLSLRAARELRDSHGIRARVADLRWLNPLNERFIVDEARTTGKVLIVDEGRRTAGVGESILAMLYEQGGLAIKAKRLSALDTYVPLGPAADLVMPTERDIVNAALEVVRYR